jgi:hypothetical protein
LAVVEKYFPQQFAKQEQNTKIRKMMSRVVAVLCLVLAVSVNALKSKGG